MRGNLAPIAAIMPAIRRGTNAHTPAVMPVAVAFPFPAAPAPNRGFSLIGGVDAATNGTGSNTSFVNTEVYNIQAPGIRASTSASNALWFRTTSIQGNETIATTFLKNQINYGLGSGPGNPIFMAIDTVEIAKEDYQPLTLPVIQLNNPNSLPQSTGGPVGPGEPDRNDFTFINDLGNGSGKWTQEAENTKVNAIFVAGGSPARTFVRYDTVSGSPKLNNNEGGGDLPNFIRLLENWRNKTLSIQGGFYQNRKSRFATAPYTPTFPYRDITLPPISQSLITSIFRDYIGKPVDTSNDGGNKESYISRTSFGIPYYFPPIRTFGYDVGILSVAPNLFDSLFTELTPGANEYFRETNRDDSYIQSLLCAVQNPSNPLGGANSTQVNTPSNYTEYAIDDPNSRPASCQANPNYI